jgi:hypothetical protein
MKNKYKVLNPIAWSGRKERGEVVEMNEVEASNFLNNLILVEQALKLEEEKANEPEKSITELSIIELKNKAKELGLSFKGSKADLIERITLFLSGDITN